MNHISLCVEVFPGVCSVRDSDGGSGREACCLLPSVGDVIDKCRARYVV